MDLIKKELKIMYMLDHEYVVKLYSHFEEPDSVFLIMELTQGVIFYGLLFKFYYRGRFMRN